MKTIIQRIVGTLVLFAIFAAASEAQDSSSSQQPTSAQQVAWNQVPPSGTFWVEGPNGFVLPYPCPPVYLSDAPIYALDNGQFLVDARNSKHFNQPVAAAQSFGPLGPSPMNKKLLVSTNAWFNQIVISNCTFVSVTNATFDLNGNLMTHGFPSGGLYLVTTTNLLTPLAQWQPVGQTNNIGNTNFNVAFTNAYSFYRVCAQLNTNIPLANVQPFSMIATNISIVTDYGVTLTWTNGQPGQSPEDDTVVEMDPYGHSYLVDSVTTTGTVGSLSFQLDSTNGLTFVRYWSTANSPGDQFFLPTNTFNNPDVVTVPYLIDTNSGRTIIEVDAYDVTDPSNPQFLAKDVKQGTGPESTFKGTLEIPGVSLVSGVETLEFRATDSGFGQTATDITITNNRLVSITSPVLELKQNGTNRVAASGGGYGISFQAQTTAANGTWNINVYDPSGNLVSSSSAAVTNIGQSIIFDDGSTPSTLYPQPYYDIEVTVQSPSQGAQSQLSDPPSSIDTHIIRVYLLPPTGNAGSIVGYDDEPSAMPSSSSDKQFVINTLAGDVSQLFEFVYQIVNIDNGQWQTISQATAVPLNDPPGVGWGWRALQAGLSGESYNVTLLPNYTWSTQTPDRPILGVSVHGHGGEDENGVAIGVQGPDGFSDSSLTEQSLQENWDFNKDTNAVAIALFTGCRVGGGPFMQFILRDKGQSGQISTSTATANKIRPCFGIAWTRDISLNSLTDQFGWISYWTLYAGDNSGTSFYNSLDAAFNLANNNYTGSGGIGAVWSGTASETLDQFAQ